MFRLFILYLLTCVPTALFAWKPTTHVYFAEQAVADAVDDGMITIRNLSTGNDLIYPVDPTYLKALKSAKQYYKAGVMGPDAFPDIATGQQYIHPPEEETKVPGGSKAWLAQVWSRIPKGSGTDKAKADAFRLGFLTHAAGDMYAHSFINYFTGAPFTVLPPTNAIQHVIIEGYIDKRLPADEIKGEFFNVSIKGLEKTIYTNMVDARAKSSIDKGKLLQTSGAGAKFSVPRIYSSLRNNLARDIKTYNNDVKDFQRRYDNCTFWDLSCSRAAIVVEWGAYELLHAVPTAYKVHWVDDIDDGLQAWPKTSHEIAKALFFNPSRKADTDAAEAVMNDYVNKHLLSMSGLPDWAGLTKAAIEAIIRAITPQQFIDAIDKLKKEALNTLVEAAIGISLDELKAYLTTPDKYFDTFVNADPGAHVSLEDFNKTYLKISDTGYTNPSESFDYNNVPAAYNSVVMSKLILLSQASINQLMKDLDSIVTLDQPNVMLGFIPTLDGTAQWRDGLVFAKDCPIYDQLLMSLPVDKGSCS